MFKCYRRVWVHVEGYNTPAFDSDGFITSCDNTGDLINDVVTFLDAALENDILVLLVLWNGALVTNENEVNLILDDLKIQSYINTCLKVSQSIIQPDNECFT